MPPAPGIDAPVCLSSTSAADSERSTRHRFGSESVIGFRNAWTWSARIKSLREATGHPDNGAPRLRQRTGHGSRADRRGQRRFTGARGYRQSQLATGESLEPVGAGRVSHGHRVSSVADTLTLRHRPAPSTTPPSRPDSTGPGERVTPRLRARCRATRAADCARGSEIERVGTLCIVSGNRRYGRERLHLSRYSWRGRREQAPQGSPWSRVGSGVVVAGPAICADCRRADDPSIPHSPAAPDP